MPLNVRRFFASVLLSLFAFIFVHAQTAPPPTTGDVMRERIAKAKAYIVVKNYNAAIYELENIRRETNDPNIHAMLNVLLMHSYLEQTDYKRGQTLLTDLYKDLKANKPNAMISYYAVAGQIVKGARTQLERYKSVGLSVSDRNLPLEALVDIDKMRETLELVVTQSKELGADKKQAATAFPLLEEAINARGSLAKDDYDANRWKREVGEARETIIDSRSTIINAVDGTTDGVSPQNTLALNTPPKTQTDTSLPPTKTSETTTGFQPVQTTNDKPKPNTETIAKIEKPAEPASKESTKQEPPKTVEPADQTSAKQPSAKTPNQRQRIIVGNNQPAKQEETTPPTETVADTENTLNTSPMQVGSLIEFATKRVNPVYPPTARMMRMTGVVRVEVTIDEEGKVSVVENTNGPKMLQSAAADAVRKWQFKPFTRDGQPTKAKGFISFNFNL